MTILFVCTGNTCRSPLALAWWRVLQERGEVPARWSAFSAGLAASGEEAAPHAVEIARTWGEDLSEHRARLVDDGALRHVDICVAVTPSHARALRGLLQRKRRSARVLCLSDFLPHSPEEDALSSLIEADAGERTDEIADPYGGSREAYEACASLITTSVSRLARRLVEERGAQPDTPENPAASR